MVNRNFTEREYYAMLKRFEQIEIEYAKKLKSLKDNEPSIIHITYSRVRIRNIERLIKAIEIIKTFPFNFNRQYHYKNFTYKAEKRQRVSNRKVYTQKQIEF